MNRWFRDHISRRGEAAHLALGRWGERKAARYLRQQGYRILEKRLRIGPHDEIDLIVRSAETVLFVEVKTRRTERHGRPFCAVDARKRKNLSRAAIAYLKENKLQPAYIRFDVIEVIGEPGPYSPELRHIENAFTLDARYRLWW